MSVALHCISTETPPPLCLSFARSFFPGLSSSCQPDQSLHPASSAPGLQVSWRSKLKTVAIKQKSQKSIICPNLTWKLGSSEVFCFISNQYVFQTTYSPLHYKRSLHLILLSPSVDPSIHLPLSLSACLAFSPFFREGHKASGDPVPQEESNRPPPSFCFFITYYLCLTDLLQTNGCHMEKERQRRTRKEKKISLPCEVFFSFVTMLRGLCYYFLLDGFKSWMAACM